MSTLDARHTRSPTGTRPGIDPRGPQLTAALTAVVLAGVLVLAPSPAATGILAVQAGLFALAATRGVQHTPYAWIFRTFVRLRLAAPKELEDPAPPRFAQALGLAFAVIGLLGFLSGADLVGLVAIGCALTAALLNAVFRLCLGCELYLLYKKVTT